MPSFVHTMLDARAAAHGTATWWDDVILLPRFSRRRSHQSLRTVTGGLHPKMHFYIAKGLFASAEAAPFVAQPKNGIDI
jgi:hypothetical protein